MEDNVSPGPRKYCIHMGIGDLGLDKKGVDVTQDVKIIARYH